MNLGRQVYYPGLIVLFAICFSIPLWLGFEYFREAQEESSDERDSVFPRSVRVGGPGDHVRLRAAEEFQPTAGNDFLLFFWIKLRKLPPHGQKVVFLNKADWDEVSKRGYHFGLVRDDMGVFPVLSWKAPSGAGQVYQFQHISFHHENWLFFSFNLQQDSFLGLHFAELDPEKDPRIQLLGGYKLDENIAPRSRADLIIGAKGLGFFRGFVGPLGIYNGKPLGENLLGALEDIVDNPLEVPSMLDSEGIQVWTRDWINDQSGKNRELSISLVKRGKRKKNRKKKNLAQKGAGKS